MKKDMFTRLALLLLLVIGGSEIASAQFEVAPTRLILTMRERSKEVNVVNTTDGPIEVEVDLGYKLIRTDSLGTMTLDSTGTPEELKKSGRDWLKIYPRRFSLAPHASRMVRVMVTIPADAEDGEYWGRAIVTSNPVAPVPTGGNDTAGIETKLTMRLQLDLPVIIRKGDVQTGIVLDGVQARPDAEGTALLADLRRTGNSAYRGTLAGVLRRSDGSEVARAEDQYTAEFSLRKTLHFPALQDGSYVLTLTSESVKKGGANEAVIASPTVSGTYAVVVAGRNITVTAQE